MNNLWSQFESRIVTDSRFHGVYVARIPSEMKQVGGKTFRKKTSFDFAAALPGKTLFFDAKACGENTFNFQSLVLRDKKIHQFRALGEAWDMGNPSGYLIWFYEKQVIVWAHVVLVQDLVAKGIKSLDEKTSGVRIQRDDVPINLVRLVGENDVGARSV
jgi:penicillin-binding protein-related factor A (putative recombinase)